MKNILKKNVGSFATAKLKAKRRSLLAIALALVSALSTAACSVQTINSVTALKEYLDKQPSNGPDKPVRVTMSANDRMIGDIAEALRSAGKYVSLTLSGSALTAIPSFAFYYCRRLASITIGNGVTTIGDRAFDGCTSLAGVTIGNGVTTIGYNAFAGCTGLTGVTIPASVTSIGVRAFYDCASLASVTFQGTISASNFSSTYSFDGDLCDKYLAGGQGTYMRASGSGTWTKS